MAFSDIIGHKKQLEYLQKLLKNGQFAHAYLFSGPKHLGKATTAKAFLQAITDIPPEQNPDAVYLSGKGTIPVEDIRVLRERLSLSGLGTGKKVALIDGADQMTPAAQNALLKTLEEPRGDTILVLVAHRSDRLLETIRSRCAHIRFHPVAPSSSPIAGGETPQRHPSSHGGAGGGFFPGLEILMQDDEHREQHEMMTREAEAFLRGALWQRIAMIERWVKEKRELPMTQWEELLHARLHQGDTQRPLTALMQLRDDLARNSNKQLALQHFARSL